MARQAETVVDSVRARGAGVAQHLHRMEQLFDEGRLGQTDLHRVYAGAYLTFFVHFENTLEDLFLGLLTGRVQHASSSVRPLASIQSNRVARRVVCGDRSYADWLPFDKTKKRADGLFAGGRPFSSLSNSDAKVFRKGHLIRNSIAHESRHSLAQFSQRVAAPASAAPTIRPAAFLRGTHAGTQSRIEFWMANISRAFAELAK